MYTNTSTAITNNPTIVYIFSNQSIALDSNAKHSSPVVISIAVIMSCYFILL